MENNEQTYNQTFQSSGYILEPKTLAEFKHNAEFQLDNVVGWMYTNEYECALIKARCLVECLEKVIKEEAKENNGHV